MNKTMKRALAWFSALSLSFSLASITASAETIVVREADCKTQTNGIEKVVEDGKTTYRSVAWQHTEGEVKDVVNPTCEEAGSVTFACAVCGEEYTVTQEATGHDYVEKASVANCTESAMVEMVCSVCGKVDPSAERIPVGEPNGHTEVSTVIPADCETDEHVVVSCSVCGKTLRTEAVDGGQTAVGAHVAADAVEENIVEGDCQHEGSKDIVVYCENCGIEMSRETVSVPGTHVNEEVTIRAAACGKPGIVKVYCAVCGEAHYQSIPAEHQWGEAVTVVEPTCTDEGEAQKTCATCGETTTVAIAALGHQMGEAEVVTEATCSAAGLVRFTCTACEEIVEEAIEQLAHSFVDEKVVDATCTTAAQVGSFCSVCGTENPEKPAETVGEALGHKWGASQLQEADCENGAYDYQICTVCGEKETVADLSDLEPALNHKTVTTKENEVAATCSADGSYEEVVTCETCGKEISRTTVVVPADASAHVYDIDKDLTAAGCSNRGVNKKHCSECGRTFYSSVPASHTWADASENTATCTEAGTVDQECSVCGETQTVATEALGHDYGEYVVTLAPTCVAGSETCTCSRCGDEQTREVEAVDEHDFSLTEEEVPATCDTPAYMVTRCAVCGTIEEGSEVEVEGSTLGHKYEENFVDPTCEDCGHVALKCTVCGDEQRVDLAEEYPALNHDLVTVNSPATCQAGAHTTTTCTRCDYSVDEVTSEPDSSAHTPSESVIGSEHDCTGRNIIKTVCADCGVSLGYVSRQGEHTVAAWEVHAATCTEDGYTSGTCEVCGETVTTDVIAATGHSEPAFVEGENCYICTICLAVLDNPVCGHEHTVAVEGTAATCTEAGLTEGTVCEDCGEVIVAQEEIAALGHTEETVAAVEATCTESGLIEGTVCSVCGEVITAQEVIPALGHTEQAVAGTAATCTEAGLTDGTVCSVCGEVITAQEEIPAAGHVHTTVPGTAATCTEAGMTDGDVCSVCGTVFTAQEEIAAAGHNMVVTWSFNSDFTKKIKTTTCTVCGAVTVEEFDF